MIKGHLKVLLKGKDNDFVYKFGEAHDSDLEKILMSYKKTYSILYIILVWQL